RSPRSSRRSKRCARNTALRSTISSTISATSSPASAHNSISENPKIGGHLMRRTLSALLTLSLVFAGCKLKEAVDKASISKDLDKRGTMDLMKEVANDKYDPPKDGKLTDGQVQMYLKVREREKAIAQVARKEAEQHA